MTSDPDELDLTEWAGPIRGVHHPTDDWHEEDAAPPEGPTGVSDPPDDTTPAAPDGRT